MRQLLKRCAFQVRLQTRSELSLASSHIAYRFHQRLRTMTVGASLPLSPAASGAQLSQLTPEKLPNPKASVSGQQIALVTGGNRGIGLEVVKSLLDEDAC